MARRLVILPAARTDILVRFEYLLECGALDAADRFLDAVDNATERLREMPGVGVEVTTENERLAGLRSWPVPRFEAVRIYYLTTTSTIRVVRVLHGMMDVPSLLETSSDE